MAQCEEQVFSGITSEHFRTFLEKAEQYGILGLRGQGNSGQASRAGITIRWSYQSEAEHLTVQCTEAPTLLPCSMINNKIGELVSSVLSHSGIAASSIRTGEKA